MTASIPHVIAINNMTLGVTSVIGLALFCYHLMSSSHHELCSVNHDLLSEHQSAVTDQSDLVVHQSSAITDQSAVSRASVSC